MTSNDPGLRILPAIVLSVCLISAPAMSSDGHQQPDGLGDSGPGSEQPFDLPPPLGIGTEVASGFYAAWNVDVSPGGEGLPDASGTVSDGKDIFEAYCASCHSVDELKQSPYPMLVGGFGTLRTTNAEHTEPAPVRRVGDYWPYASTLFDYVRRAMPFSAPKSLEDDEIYALTAYILRANGIGDFDDALDREAFISIEMPNRDGFLSSDPRPDTQNTACMVDCLGSD